MSRMTTVAVPNFRYILPWLDIGAHHRSNLRFIKTTRHRPRNQGYRRFGEGPVRSGHRRSTRRLLSRSIAPAGESKGFSATIFISVQHHPHDYSLAPLN